MSYYCECGSSFPGRIEFRVHRRHHCRRSLKRFRTNEEEEIRRNVQLTGVTVEPQLTVQDVRDINELQDIELLQDIAGDQENEPQPPLELLDRNQPSFKGTLEISPVSRVP